jgi:hypothetical protein
VGLTIHRLLDAPVVVVVQALPPRSRGWFGFMRLERESPIMMCPEPSGRVWAERKRSWVEQGGALRATAAPTVTPIAWWKPANDHWYAYLAAWARVVPRRL